MRMQQQQQQQQGAKGQESPPRLLLIAGDHGLRERMGWDRMGRLLGTACVDSAAKRRVVDDRNGRAWYLPLALCVGMRRDARVQSHTPYIYRLQSILFGSGSSI